LGQGPGPLVTIGSAPPPPTTQPMPPPRLPNSLENPCVASDTSI
jgi:hypothetical protein